MTGCEPGERLSMSNGTPWLSVIIPSHNGERWLGTALQSIVDQGEQGIEVIIVDSSDSAASLAIVDGFSTKLDLCAHRRPDLRPWTTKTNFAVRQARGRHICMLHQDDFWLPGRCAKMRQWLSVQPNAVMHIHPVYIVDEAGKRLGLWRCPLPGGEDPVPREMLMERLLVQEFIAIPAPVIRRDAFLGVGGMDEELGQTGDWDLYLKLAAAGEVCYHPDPLACFRIHKKSLTVMNSRNIEDYRRQLQIVLDRYSGNLTPTARPAVLRVAAASIDVNTALAAANNGKLGQLFKAVLSLARLGLPGLSRYLCYSRLWDRLFPRLRARFAGGL